MGRRKGGECSFIRGDRRKSHFSQCINLPRKGEEGRTEERGREEGREGEEEIQNRVKWAGCEKRSSSWSLFRKGPPLSCWVLLSSCPPGTMLVEQLPPTTTTQEHPRHPPTCPPTALPVPELRWQPGPQTPAYGGQTRRPALQCAPQLGLCWRGQLGFTQPPALCTHMLHNQCGQAENGQKYEVSGSDTQILIYVWWCRARQMLLARPLEQVLRDPSLGFLPQISIIMDNWIDYRPGSSLLLLWYHSSYSPCTASIFSYYFRIEINFYGWHIQYDSHS